MKKAKKMLSKDEFISKTRKLSENAMKFYPFLSAKCKPHLNLLAKMPELFKEEQKMNRMFKTTVVLLVVMLGKYNFRRKEVLG